MSRFMDNKLKALEPYTPGEQPPDMDGLIKLNTNESPFPPSPMVLAALNRGEMEKLRLYSDPECGPFITAIAESHGVGTENVFPCNGSDEALAFCFHGLCQNGAAYADVTYGFYRVFAAMFGVEPHVVPLREDFSLNTDDYSGLRATVFIANPNAPTGIALPAGDIERLLNMDRDRLVIVDEAYVEFGAETALPLLKRHENLLIVRTFSKSRSLAGARLGYAIGPAEIIADLNTMKYSFNPYNVGRMGILAGEAAMKDAKYFEVCCAAIMENREYTTRQLRGLGFTVPESKANFIFAGGHPWLTGGDFFRLLREKGILVRHFPAARTENYVRITIGTQEQMHRLVNAAKEIVEGGLSHA